LIITSPQNVARKLLLTKRDKTKIITTSLMLWGPYVLSQN